MIRHARALITVSLLALVLAGCAQLGVPKPQTPAQTLALLDSQFTALVETAADMRADGEFSQIEQNQLGGIIFRGSAIIDQAWDALIAGKSADADRYMQLAEASLMQLRDLIQAHQDREGAT